MNTRGSRLRAAIEARDGWTQDRLARELQVHPSTVNGWILYGKEPEDGPDGWLQIAKELKISVLWLLFGIGEMEGDPLATALESLPPAKRSQAADFVQFLNTQDGGSQSPRRRA